MELKPVNSINNDSNTIRVSDGNSPIRLIFKDAKGEVINLYDKIDYFYLTKDDETFYSVTDISYEGDEVIIRLPKLRKGQYKAEIRDKDGSIYPANEDLYILLRRSFEDDKDIYYFGHREDILNSVEPMVIQHIEKNPDKFRGERGQQGFPGRDGLRGLDGKDGEKGDKGEQGIQGIQGIKGDKGPQGDKGQDAIIPENILSMVQTYDETYLIPSDYISLQNALDDLSTRNIKQGFKINLVIESGHRPNTPLILRGGEYSQFTISGEDAIIPLAVSFPKTPFMLFESCTAPIVNALFNGLGLNSMGIRVDKGSSLTINSGCGFIQSGSSNLYATGGSIVHSSGGVFTGGSQDSTDATDTGGAGATAWGATIFLENGDVSGSKVYGVQAAHGGFVSFKGGKADDAGRHGIRATNGATLDARGASAKNCGVYGVYALSASTVNAYGTSCINAGVAGIYGAQASRINARECDVSGSDTGLLVERASIADFYGGIANNCKTNGIKANSGSSINGFDVTIDSTGVNTTNHGVSCILGSTITLSGSRITNSLGRDVYINDGSTVNLKTSKTTNSTENKPVVGDTNVTSLNTLGGFGIIWG